jgi:hypothetical protein
MLDLTSESVNKLNLPRLDSGWAFGRNALAA